MIGATRMRVRGLFPIAAISLLLAACATPKAPPPPAVVEGGAPYYLIGPGDTVNVFVWGNPDLSATVPVRPDGRITTPLVEDVQASGKTPTALAREMEKRLARYIKNPVVTVIVTGFTGRFTEQVRVVGAAARPQSLPYKEHLSLLDVMIAVGGLADHAAGNRALLVRNKDGVLHQYQVRLDDLVRHGDITANAELMPGDVLIIPESWF